MKPPKDALQLNVEHSRKHVNKPLLALVAGVVLLSACVPPPDIPQAGMPPAKPDVHPVLSFASPDSLLIGGLKTTKLQAPVVFGDGETSTGWYLIDFVGESGDFRKWDPEAKALRVLLNPTREKVLKVAFTPEETDLLWAEKEGYQLAEQLTAKRLPTRIDAIKIGSLTGKAIEMPYISGQTGYELRESAWKGLTTMDDVAALNEEGFVFAYRLLTKGKLYPDVNYTNMVRPAEGKVMLIDYADMLNVPFSKSSLEILWANFKIKSGLGKIPLRYSDPYSLLKAHGITDEIPAATSDVVLVYRTVGMGTRQEIVGAISQGSRVPRIIADDGLPVVKSKLIMDPVIPENAPFKFWRIVDNLPKGTVEISANALMLMAQFLARPVAIVWDGTNINPMSGKFLNSEGTFAGSNIPGRIRLAGALYNSSMYENFCPPSIARGRFEIDLNSISSEKFKQAGFILPVGKEDVTGFDVVVPCPMGFSTKYDEARANELLNGNYPVNLIFGDKVRVFYESDDGKTKTPAASFEPGQTVQLSLPRLAEAGDGGFYTVIREKDNLKMKFALGTISPDTAYLPGMEVGNQGNEALVVELMGIET